MLIHLTMTAAHRQPACKAPAKVGNVPATVTTSLLKVTCPHCLKVTL